MNDTHTHTNTNTRTHTTYLSDPEITPEFLAAFGSGKNADSRVDHLQSLFVFLQDFLDQRGYEVEVASLAFGRPSEGKGTLSISNTTI